MKRKLFFFLLLCSLIYPFKTSALSFTACDNNTHEVNSFTTLYHYFYYQLKANNVSITDNNQFLMYCASPSSGYCYFLYISSSYSGNFFINSNNRLRTDSSVDYIKQSIYQYDGVPDSNDIPQYENLSGQWNLSVANSTTYNFLNFVITKSGSTVASGTDKLSDIDEIYCPSSVEPEPEEPEPEEPEHERVYPINTNDYYLGIMLFSLLIWLLYFKWCFPMKGGRKI